MIQPNRKIISPIYWTKCRDFVKFQLYLGVWCNLCSTPFRTASVELRASFYHVPPGRIHRQSSHRQCLWLPCRLGWNPIWSCCTSLVLKRYRTPIFCTSLTPVGHKVRNSPRFFIQLYSSTTSLSRRSSRFWSTLLLRLKEVSAPAGLRAWRFINYVCIYGEEICILLSNIFTTPLYHQQSSQPTPIRFLLTSFYSYCFDWSD